MGNGTESPAGLEDYRLRMAMAGYRLGWSFTPLTGKRPNLGGWTKRPREHMSQLGKWARDGNIGLRTGFASAGLVVVDIDRGGSVSQFELPRTVSVVTGSGTRHLYFSCPRPLGNSVGRLAENVDIRADGGQVVYPGSIHPDTGRPYRFEPGCSPEDIEVAALPEEIYRLLTGPATGNRLAVAPVGASVSTGHRYSDAVITGELDAVRRSHIGGRNDRLNKAAFTLGRLVADGRCDEQEITRQLVDAALAAGLGSREAERTVQSGLTAAAKAGPGSAGAHYGGGSGSKALAESGSASRSVGGYAVTPRGGRGFSSGADYVLLPGAHTDSEGRYTEQSGSGFAADVLARVPEGSLYRKDMVVGELVGQPGQQRFYEANADRVRLIVDENMSLSRWWRSSTSTVNVRQYRPCSRDAANLVLAAAHKSPRVLPLKLMVNYPVFLPDMTLCEPGYTSGIYYDQPEELAGLRPVTDCEIIHNVLHDLVVDFPFAGEADRQNFFGLLLTPMLAPAIDGNRPLHLLGAPLERTGKTKLAEDVFGGIILGHPTPAMQLTDREEEHDKRIISLLLQGHTLVHLDNMPGFVNSPTLASLLTASTYSGRMLGRSQMLSLPNNLTLVASGNNVNATGEIVKRIVPITLMPDSSQPERRGNFHHPDLRSYVRTHRRIVLECLLGLVHNWIDAGRPAGSYRMGGFENFGRIIGGVLQVNGFNLWCKNQCQWLRDNDPRADALEQFVSQWWDSYRTAPVSASELMRMVDEKNLLDGQINGLSQRARKTSLGIFMRRHRDRPVSNWKIKINKARTTMYFLEKI